MRRTLPYSVADFSLTNYSLFHYIFNSSQSEFLFIFIEGMAAFVEKRKPTYVGE